MFTQDRFRSQKAGLNGEDKWKGTGLIQYTGLNSRRLTSTCQKKVSPDSFPPHRVPSITYKTCNYVRRCTSYLFHGFLQHRLREHKRNTGVYTLGDRGRGRRVTDLVHGPLFTSRLGVLPFVDSGTSYSRVPWEDGVTYYCTHPLFESKLFGDSKVRQNNNNAVVLT